MRVRRPLDNKTRILHHARKPCLLVVEFLRPRYVCAGMRPRKRQNYRQRNGTTGGERDKDREKGERGGSTLTGEESMGNIFGAARRGDFNPDDVGQNLSTFCDPRVTVRSDGIERCGGSEEC